MLSQYCQVCKKEDRTAKLTVINEASHLGGEPGLIRSLQLCNQCRSKYESGSLRLTPTQERDFSTQEPRSIDLNNE